VPPQRELASQQSRELIAERALLPGETQERHFLRFSTLELESAKSAV
jgi:hypothetical protein